MRNNLQVTQQVSCHSWKWNFGVLPSDLVLES